MKMGGSHLCRVRHDRRARREGGIHHRLGASRPVRKYKVRIVRPTIFLLFFKGASIYDVHRTFRIFKPPSPPLSAKYILLVGQICCCIS